MHVWVGKRKRKRRDGLHNHVKDASQEGELSVCALESKAVDQSLCESGYIVRIDCGVKQSRGQRNVPQRG